MRSCSGRTNSFASVVKMVQVSRPSPCGPDQRSHKPAKAKRCWSLNWKRKGCFSLPRFCQTTMSTPATPAASPSLEQRLACLEAHRRELRRQLGELRLAVAVIALGLILYSAWRTLFTFPVRATVVEAQRVVVRDAAGRARLVLGTDDVLPDAFRAKDNPGVLLCDEKGALRAQLYASEELSGLGLFDLDGKPRVALTHRNGWSGCFLKDRGDAIRVGMALDAGGPRLVVQDEKERVLFGQP
jgi:hypothetical protein